MTNKDQKEFETKSVTSDNIAAAYNSEEFANIDWEQTYFDKKYARSLNNITNHSKQHYKAKYGLVAMYGASCAIGFLTGAPGLVAVGGLFAYYKIRDLTEAQAKIRTCKWAKENLVGQPKEVREERRKDYLKIADKNVSLFKKIINKFTFPSVVVGGGLALAGSALANPPMMYAGLSIFTASMAVSTPVMILKLHTDAATSVLKEPYQEASDNARKGAWQAQVENGNALHKKFMKENALKESFDASKTAQATQEQDNTPKTTKQKNNNDRRM